MVKTKNSVENPDSQIMDTIPLEQDLQELFQQSYNYDQRTYTSGEKPKNKLGVAVERFEEDLENAGDREEERLEKVADMRAYRELSKMAEIDINSMSWEQCHRWSELQQQYPNLNIRKEQEDDATSPLPMAMSENYTDQKNIDLHRQILESLESVQDLAAEQNLDISHEVQAIKIELRTFIDKIKNMDSEVVEKGIKKGLMNHDIQKHVKQNYIKKSNILKKSCTKGHCDLYLDDGLKNIGAQSGRTIRIYKSGRWDYV